MPPSPVGVCLFDIQPYCMSNKQTPTGEGSIVLHLPGGQEMPMSQWVPDNTV